MESSQVKVFEDNKPPLANLVIIERAEPYTPEQLGFKKPVAPKGKRVKNPGKDDK